MTITRKSTYALRALAVMARAPSESHSVWKVSELENIPKTYLSAILTVLVRHGFVSSRRGPGGGYALGCDAQHVSLAHVINALEGPLFSLTCLGAEARCAECVAWCPARWALRAADRAAWAALDSLHVADLAEHCTEYGSRFAELPRVLLSANSRALIDNPGSERT